MKKGLKFLGIGLGYMSIFVILQLIVLIVVSFCCTFIVGVEFGMSGASPDYKEIEIVVMEKIASFTDLMAVISGIISIAIVCLIFVIRHKNIKEEINLKPISLKCIPILIIMGISLNFLIAGVMSILPIPESVMYEYEQASKSLEKIGIVSFIATVIVAPLSEEIFCRGLMLSRFRKGIPIVISIILQAFIFGLIHGNFLWIIYATIIGIIFGVIAYKQKSIVGTIIMHSAFNLTSFIMIVANVEINNGKDSIGIASISAIIFILSSIYVLNSKSKKLEINNTDNNINEKLNS